jgi:hypothetical protein
MLHLIENPEWIPSCRNWLMLLIVQRGFSRWAERPEPRTAFLPYSRVAIFKAVGRSMMPRSNTAARPSMKGRSIELAGLSERWR